MAETSKRLFGLFMSKGDMDAADEVLDPDVVYRDNMFWGPGLMVGAHKLKAYISELRFKYPDLWYDVEQMSMQDSTHMWISWTGHGTNMQASDAAASYHSSTYSGVSVLTFTSDRTKIREISMFRQPTAEEKHELTHSKAADPFEIKLARLHWEPRETSLKAASGPAKPPASGSSSSGSGSGGRRDMRLA